MKDNILGLIGLSATGVGAAMYKFLEKIAPVCADITIVLGTLIGITVLLLNLAKLKDRWDKDFKYNKNEKNNRG